MSGGSFDVSKTRVCRDKDADYLFSVLFDYVKRTQGLSEKTGGVQRTYFGGLDSNSYFEYDETTKKLTLYLDGDKKIEWNA